MEHEKQSRPCAAITCHNAFRNTNTSRENSSTWSAPKHDAIPSLGMVCVCILTCMLGCNRRIVVQGNGDGYSVHRGACEYGELTEQAMVTAVVRSPSLDMYNGADECSEIRTPCIAVIKVSFNWDAYSATFTTVTTCHVHIIDNIGDDQFAW